jgi:D-alanyl-lipoteichoic acid acyltransferase DltB (MBOAT superfamily)
LGLLLPVGLSFVAFQGISLVVDVYRGQVEPRHTYPEHLLYLLFFPQVVAGPIVRARDLLARFRQTPRLDPETGARGLYRIATGMAKKLLIADVLAAGLVDRVFEDPSLYTSAECLAATLAYTFQLYCDFSAYSDIAIGAAALFGFALPENFAKPYLARNLFEFWNRWHISLSTWLRDYLYIPLGGNRCSRPRVLFNLMVVMSWRALGTGLLALRAVGRGARGGARRDAGLVVAARGRPKEHSWYGAAAGMAATFTVVVLTRIVFRCADLPAAGRMVRALAELSGGLANVSLPVWAALAAAALSHALPPAVYERSAGLFARLPVPVRAAALVGLALVVRQVAAVELRPYIYFQF